MVAKKFKKRVLSIDGGGIRGIIPAMILNYIETQTGKPIATMFDTIAGTSTGGIIVLGLTKRNSDPKSNHQAQYTAADLLKIYCERGQEIFTENIPTSIDDFIQPKINPAPKQRILTSILGETPIEDAMGEIFLTSYDIELRIPVFFTSNRNAEENNRRDSRRICRGFTMVNAAMATSAAPTFFPPYNLTTTHPTFLNSNSKFRF